MSAQTALRVDVVSIFPETFDAIACAGITARALASGLWQLHRWNPRDFTSDTYRRVDDRPYGGGPGMVMLAAPLRDAVQAAQAGQAAHAESPGPVISLSPQGEPLTHRRVAELAQVASVTIVAGRYEALDQRFIDRHVDHEFCVGDFVVSGGELPAMMLIDAMVRLLPGALNDADSSRQDSFVDGLLDCPHFTRPELFEGSAVPPVLLSGNHANILAWRRQQALLTTARRRPELIVALRATGALTADDEAWLAGQE